MKNLQLIVCPNCWEQGDNLHRTKEGDLICGRCGHRWREDTAKELEEILTSRLDAEKQKACIRARHNLYQQVKAENISSVAVLQWTQEVKKYFPDDFLANFYEIACGKDKSRLPNFIEETDMMKEKTFLPAALDFLLRSPTDHFLTNALRIVERAYNNGAMEQGVCTEYRTRISQLQQQCDEGYFVASLPRDVFIAYSSADMSAVNELEAYLNQQGFSTFVAAHNLMHGVGAVENYEEEIETALHHCKAFVFVSTPHSRTMKCDAMGVEVKWVREHAPHMSRIEYRPSYDINESQPVAKDILKEFFKGCQPCNSKEEVYHRLVEKLYSVAVDTATPSPTPVEKPVPIEVPKPTVVILEKYNKSKFEIEDTVLKKYKGKEKIVFIPYGVTSIGDRAFYGCTSLTSITIPSSVTVIESGVFSNCTSLTSLKFLGTRVQWKTAAKQWKREEVPTLEYVICSDDSIVPTLTLENCDKSEFEIEGTVLKKYKGSWTRYTGGKITIPEGITRIDDSAFIDCKSLVSVMIPDSVTSIGERAFDGCKSLTSIKIPSSVTSIGNRAFDACPLGNLSVARGNPVYHSEWGCLFDTRTNTLIRGSKDGSIIPKTVTCSIGDRAFYGCTSLTSITIPTSVTSIGENAFAACEMLSTVDIFEGVTSICQEAFMGCDLLRAVTIPKSVTSIGADVFRGCKMLTSLKYRGTKKQWKAIKKDRGWKGGGSIKSVMCSDGELKI